MAFINGKKILFSSTIQKTEVYKDKLVRLVAPDSITTASAVTAFPEGLVYRSNDFSPDGMAKYIDSTDQDEIFFAVTEQRAAPAGFIIDLGETKYIELLQAYITDVYYATKFNIYWADESGEFLEGKQWTLNDGTLDVYRFEIKRQARYIKVVQAEGWTRYRFVVKGIEVFSTLTSSLKYEVKDANKTEYITMLTKPEQEKEVIPSASDQEITPDEGYSLSKVTVKGARLASDFIKARGAQYLFYNCNDLMADDLSYLLNYDDTAEATSTSHMFYGCNRLLEVPLLDTRNVTTMSNMFYGCNKLLEVPLLDTSNVTNMDSMVAYCQAITTIPLLDTSKVNSMSAMFLSCSKLTEIPLLDTRKVSLFTTMFKNCKLLTKVHGLDMRKASSATSMFSGCAALTEVYIKNIKINLQVGSGTSYGHLIILECLISLINEVWNTGSAIKLTVGSANLAKLANVYVKAIEITDYMRAEDEYIDYKYPFTVCESTDEGATLVTEYALTVKNCTIV